MSTSKYSYFFVSDFSGFNSAAFGLCKEVPLAPKMFGDMRNAYMCRFICPSLSIYNHRSLQCIYIKLYNKICICRYLQFIFIYNMYLYILTINIIC